MHATANATPAGERDVADMRNVDPRRQPGDVEKNVQAVGKLADLTATKGITASRLARRRRRCPWGDLATIDEIPHHRSRTRPHRRGHGRLARTAPRGPARRPSVRRVAP
ncbi:hypothetical protein ACF1HJ_09325 [Streptomyces sp. NPDC013978]|uniref:hypothetical protein n=1 Tax=Streptomyces sp. NPDC013978 TaxID=3364869 RepID=UPI0036FA5ED8